VAKRIIILCGKGSYMLTWLWNDKKDSFSWCHSELSLAQVYIPFEKIISPSTTMIPPTSLNTLRSSPKNMIAKKGTRIKLRLTNG